MWTIGLVVGLMLSQAAGAEESFGNQVVRCMAAKSAPLAGPQFDKLMSICEIEVEIERKADKNPISRQVGAPQEAIEANLPVVEQRAKVDHYAEFLKNTPVAAEMMRDQDRAKIARHRTENDPPSNPEPDQTTSTLAIFIAAVTISVSVVLLVVAFRIARSLWRPKPLSSPDFPKPAKDYADRFKNQNRVVDFYKFLGVDNDASDEAINHAMMQKASRIEERPAENFLKITMLSIALKHLGTPEARAAYDRTLAHGSGQPSLHKNAAIDAVLFLFVPLIFYRFLNDEHVIDSAIHQSLVVATITSMIAYVSAFTFDGGYASRAFKQRFAVMQPLFFLLFVYWLGLGFTRIADGEGSGNVLAMLFGLAASGALAWRKVKNLS